MKVQSWRSDDLWNLPLTADSKMIGTTARDVGGITWDSGLDWRSSLQSICGTHRGHTSYITWHTGDTHYIWHTGNLTDEVLYNQSVWHTGDIHRTSRDTQGTHVTCDTQGTWLTKFFTINLCDTGGTRYMWHTGDLTDEVLCNKSVWHTGKMTSSNLSYCQSVCQYLRTSTHWKSYLAKEY